MAELAQHLAYTSLLPCTQKVQSSVSFQLFYFFLNTCKRSPLEYNLKYTVDKTFWYQTFKEIVQNCFRASVELQLRELRKEIWMEGKKQYIHSNNNKVGMGIKVSFREMSSMYHRAEGFAQVLWMIRVCWGLRPSHLEKPQAIAADGGQFQRGAEWCWSVLRWLHAGLGGFHSAAISLLTA